MSAAEREGPATSGRAYRRRLALILLAGAGWRLLYVWAQPGTDPTFARPVLDGAYYLRWAEALAAGRAGVEGAFYLAPLYPYVLAGFLALAGPWFGALYALQQMLVVAAAALAGGVARRAAGDVAGLAAAALLVAHHPAIEMASRPLGEPLALALLFAGLSLAARPGGPAPATGAGLAGGLAGLARPNLLLAPALWAASATAGGRHRRAGLLVLGVVVVVLPVTVRNRVVSGHWVPVSSNAGLTAYHGNAAGARGIYTAPAGFTGDVSSQREEATRRAVEATGRPLDAVEADRHWGRLALRDRLASPWGTARLLARRVALALGPHEIGLDSHPMADHHPFRLTWGVGRPWRAEGALWREVPLVSFTVLAALAAAGLVGRGVRGSGGAATWAAILAAAATPVLFYVSSRYRLPLAALAAIPAGCGVAVLAGSPLGRGARRAALVAALATGGVSLLAGVVAAGSLRAPLADALASRAGHWRLLIPERPDALARSEAAARAALVLAPCSPCAHFHLGVVHELQGGTEEAEAAYTRALASSCPPAAPGAWTVCHATAAANQAGLWIAAGRAAEAVPLLRRALGKYPALETPWVNLVVALVGLGRIEEARLEASRAARYGVRLDPALTRLLAEGGAPGESGER